MQSTLEKNSITLTPEKETLITMINEGMSQGRIAELTGINRSYISRYINGKLEMQYIEQVEEALRRYFQAAGAWTDGGVDNKAFNGSYISNISELGMIATKDSLRVKGAFSIAYGGDFALVVGEPGTGKTSTLEELARQNSNIYMITCSRNTRNKALLKKIAEEIRVESYGTSGDIEARIIKKLTLLEGNSLLILDEADFLNLDCLETVRAIYDQVNKKRELGKGFGILLSGNEHLEEMIIMHAEENPDYKRIRDRVGIHKKLMGLSEAEVESFIERINCTNGAKEILLQIGVKRGARQLVMAMRRLLDLTNGERQITESMFETLGDIVLSFKA